MDRVKLEIALDVKHQNVIVQQIMIAIQKLHVVVEINYVEMVLVEIIMIKFVLLLQVGVSNHVIIGNVLNTLGGNV